MSYSIPFSGAISFIGIAKVSFEVAYVRATNFWSNGYRPQLGVPYYLYSQIIKLRSETKPSENYNHTFTYAAKLLSTNLDGLAHKMDYLRYQRRDDVRWRVNSNNSIMQCRIYPLGMPYHYQIAVYSYLKHVCSAIAFLTEGLVYKLAY